MVNISKSYRSIFNASNYFIQKVAPYASPSKDNFIITTGYLNYYWQSWNKFWRSFWLAYIIGGFDLSRVPINPHPLLPGATSSEAIHYLLFLLGKKRVPHGSVRGSFEEPTWGDLSIIRNIAAYSHPTGSAIADISLKVIGALNVLGDTPKHFQKVRNCSIHLDHDNMHDLNISVKPHYVIRSINYPTDIIFSREIITGKKAVQHWVDELLAVISIIYL
jgi:hypothetical protein